MRRNTFWLVTLFTVAALLIFVLSPEPIRLLIVVFPLIIFFPVALNKRRKTININIKDALLAYIPFVGRHHLSRLYLAV
ncbi:hypothetical protein H8S95_15075 [Pontibacter sp. KCTC 32443]|uniref:hypothetical protein n=1 Tax=Pontibacter TaxID=323449 RepID=UPI00164E7185|nr:MULTISPECIES: hypothetical protein [Pontibacter]MBC5775400.1 hypothetical protein [Pontibacter sp. KCTC 32443]